MHAPAPTAVQTTVVAREKFSTGSLESFFKDHNVKVSLEIVVDGEHFEEVEVEIAFSLEDCDNGKIAASLHDYAILTEPIISERDARTIANSGDVIMLSGDQLEELADSAAVESELIEIHRRSKNRCRCTGDECYCD